MEDGKGEKKEVLTKWNSRRGGGRERVKVQYSGHRINVDGQEKKFLKFKAFSRSRTPSWMLLF